MKRSSAVLLSAVCALLVACGGDGDGASAASSGNAVQGRFTVVDSLGGGFEHSSARARVRFVRGDMVELSAEGGLVRVQVRELPETGSGETDAFIRNNTLYSATLDLGGSRVRVGCSPGDPVRGRFERSAMGEGRISGSFEVEFVECSDYISGAAVDVPGLPLVVTARFEDLPLEE